MSRRTPTLTALLIAVALAALALPAAASGGRIPVAMGSPEATITIASPGTYYLVGNITTNLSPVIQVSAREVTLDLNGFTITSTAASGTGAIITADSQINLRITNGKLVGSHQAIYLTNMTTGVVLDHLTIVNQTGDIATTQGIWVAFVNDSAYPRVAVIEDITVLQSSAIIAGIAVQRMDGGRIVRNTLRGCGLTIDIGSDGTVTDNTVSGGANNGISLTSSTGFMLRRNTVNGCTWSGISLSASNFNSLTWNHCTTNGGCGIYFDPSSGHNIYASSRTPNNTSGGICGNLAGNIDATGNIFP